MTTLKIKNVGDFKDIEIDINKYNFITAENLTHAKHLCSIIKLCQAYDIRNISDSFESMLRIMGLDGIIDVNSEIEFNTERYKLVVKNMNVEYTGSLQRYNQTHYYTLEYLFASAQRQKINTLVNNYKHGGDNLIVFTNSPYIINHLNLLIAAHDANNTQFTDGASINFDELNALHINNEGKIRILKAVNKHFIDVMHLSDDINAIYEAYKILTNDK